MANPRKTSVHGNYTRNFFYRISSFFYVRFPNFNFLPPGLDNRNRNATFKS